MSAKQIQSSRISAEYWISHFSNLLSIDKKFNAMDGHFKKLCIEKEETKTFFQV